MSSGGIMDYTSTYQEKLITAKEAASLVHSGDWVDYGWTVATPVAIDYELAKRISNLTDVHIRGGILMWVPEIFKIESPEKHFDWNSWHMSGIERKASSDGFAFYSPMRYSELPRYYRENGPMNKVAYFQVAPMDEHGFFNFGPSASHMMAVCETSEIVVVEVNTNMPRCLGGSEEAVHVSQVDYIVEGTNPALAEMPAPGTASDIDEAVAKQIVDQIPNGACLQLGIGGMPNAVGSLIAKSDLKDLGVHTEIYVDSFVDITSAGKITGANKNIDRFKQTFTFAAGTKKVYDFINNNPQCLTAPTNYTNDVRVISSIDNFISINNIVDIDLFGQINAESAGTRNISGAGGQLDFVMGAYLSNGGKSFVCCSSTYTTRSGELKSRIMPTLSKGVSQQTKPTN